MKIIFATSACSKSEYKKIFEMRNRKILDPAQKFFEQLFTGVAKNNVDVVAVSARPLSASTAPKKWYKKFTECSDGVNYIYPAFFNGKILRFITVFLTSFFIVLKVLKTEKGDCFVICDPLNLQVSKAARVAAKLCGVKCIGVVTDIPVWATAMKQHNYSTIRHYFQRLYESLCMRELTSYDGYVNLTKYMDPIANPKGKPSIVIEGSVDIDVINRIENRSNLDRVVMYAGGVYEKYGLDMLVNGFIKADLENVELHIYGEGSYVEKLKKIASDYPQIKYKGVALNTDLPFIERNATLLVNPRFSNEEYTKFSFPSKTLEYMTSGTPVLSTKLAGIPEEYKPYVLWIDYESNEGVAQCLKKIFEMNNADLDQIGMDARRFVIDKKNNVSQGNMIVRFAGSI